MPPPHMHTPRRTRRVAVAVAFACSALSTHAVAQHAGSDDDGDGAQVFATACAECHGDDGASIAGADIGDDESLSAYTDNELASLIVNGIPNTTMVPSTLEEEQIEAVVLFLRELARYRDEPRIDGDVERGKALFTGKGECTSCHRIDGNGSRVGPDLSSIGGARRAAELMTSLLDPGAEVRPSNRFYRVVTSDGDEVVGRLLNHDTYTVQLLDLDERLRSFDKADLREHGFDDSPMPSYRDTLGEQEIADLVTYLESLRADSAN